MLHQCQEQPLRGTLNAFSNIFLPFWVGYTPAAQSCFQWCTNGLGSSKRSTSISNTCQDLEPQQQMTTHGEKMRIMIHVCWQHFFFLEEGIMRTEEYSHFFEVWHVKISFLQTIPCNALHADCICADGLQLLHRSGYTIGSCTLNRFPILFLFCCALCSCIHDAAALKTCARAPLHQVLLSDWCWRKALY